MTGEIYCPGERLEKILERLKPMKYEQLLLYSREDIGARLRNDFEGLDEKSLRGIYMVALNEQAEFIRIHQDILAFSGFGASDDTIEAAKQGLALHVEECKSSFGMCHDRYMLWLEKRARKVMISKKLTEEDIPGVINMLDKRYLHLFI